MKLDCSNKCIEYIDEEIIKNLLNNEDVNILTELDLSNNRINEINLKNVDNLKKLNLSNNQIKYIEKDSFGHLKNLEYLDLSNNKLDRIDEDVFKNLKNLKHLNLSNNLICEIDEKAFDDLNRLQKLSLTNNKLKSLNSNTFSKLVKLEELTLNGNKLSSLNASLFSGLNHISNLDFDLNSIDSFNNYTSLQTTIKNEFFDAIKERNEKNLQHNLTISYEKLSLENLFELISLFIDSNNSENLYQYYNIFRQIIDTKNKPKYLSIFLNKLNISRTKELMNISIQKNKPKLLQLFLFQILVLSIQDLNIEFDEYNELFKSFSSKESDSNKFNLHLKNYIKKYNKFKDVLNDIRSNSKIFLLCAKYAGSTIFQILTYLEIIIPSFNEENVSKNDNLVKLAIENGNHEFLSTLLIKIDYEILINDIISLCYRNGIVLDNFQINSLNDLLKNASSVTIQEIETIINNENMITHKIYAKFSNYLSYKLLFQKSYQFNENQLFKLAARNVDCFKCLFDKLDYDSYLANYKFPINIISYCVIERLIPTLNYILSKINEISDESNYNPKIELLNECLNCVNSTNGNRILHELFELYDIDYIIKILEKILIIYESKTFLTKITTCMNHHHMTCMDILLSSDKYLKIFEYLVEHDKLKENSCLIINYNNKNSDTILHITAHNSCIKLFTYFYQMNIKNLTVVNDLTNKSPLDELIQNILIPAEFIADVAIKYLKKFNKSKSNYTSFIINNDSFEKIFEDDNYSDLIEVLLNNTRFDKSTFRYYMFNTYIRKYLDRNRLNNENDVLFILKSYKAIFEKLNQQVNKFSFIYMISQDNINKLFQRKWFNCIEFILQNCDFNQVIKETESPKVKNNFRLSMQQTPEESVMLNNNDTKNKPIQKDQFELNDIEILTQIKNSKEQKLIELDSSFDLLNRTWHKKAWIFYTLNIFQRLIYTYLFLLYSYDLFMIRTDNNDIERNNFEKKNSFKNILFCCILFAFLALFFILELIRIILVRKKYFKDVKNILAMAAYMLAMVSLILSSISYEVYGLFSCTNLFNYLILLINLDKMKIIGIYVIAFQDSIKKYFHLLIIFVIFSFGYSFHLVTKMVTDTYSDQLLSSLLIVPLKSISGYSPGNGTTNIFNFILCSSYAYFLIIVFLSIIVGITHSSLIYIRKDCKRKFFKKRISYIIYIKRFSSLHRLINQNK